MRLLDDVERAFGEHVRRLDPVGHTGSLQPLRLQPIGPADDLRRECKRPLVAAVHEL